METHQQDVTQSHRLRLLLITMVALVVADGLISRFLVEHGLGYEGNPFLQTWINENGFLGIKFAGSSLAALLLWDINRRHPKLSFIGTLCIVIFYTGLILWSLYVFFTLQPALTDMVHL